MADWQLSRFEECVEPVVYTTKVQRKDFLAEGAHPIVSQEEGLINGFWDNEADLFRVDRPVVVFGDHTRSLKFIDFDFVLGADGVKILRPKPFLHPRFFYYQLHTAKLDSLGYARHYRLLKEHSIGYPPLPEQRRIVAILDEAFEAISMAKANTERNLLNAREVFWSEAKSVLLRGAARWPTKTVDQLSTNLDSKRVPITKSERTAGEFPYYGASGIVDYVAEYIFDGDTLLVSEDGANLLARSTPIAFSVSGQYWVNNHAHILKFANMATQKFVEFYLESIPLDEYITGAAQPKLNQKALNSIPIPIPTTLNEQAEVVDRLERIVEQSDQLQGVYERKLAALDELKKSLLHQAFTGQLTVKTTDQQLEAVA
ncbi:restriction endonuclease subunit S [Stenotrophomonas sp.]|uniref:restriction endonuclease subunit S n=1 Tax=Stenotrophomonas sp. TaxID=69392 RepID=UPI0028A6D714|nr:restriction endonuclease subunit S [Stenotrophomonas sp.]